MAIRQYIGARYVPKFFENSATGDSTWAPNTLYEPLEMVTWNGVTYTSKKPVPASIGNPALNPTYWVATSNAGEQISELVDRVTQLESDVDNAEEDITALNGRFTGSVLKISNGGTGASTIAAAKGALKLSALLEGATVAELGDIRLQTFQMGAGETERIDLGKNNRGFVVFIGATASSRGIQLYSVNSSGSVASFTNITATLTDIAVTRVGSTTEYDVTNNASGVVWGIRIYCTGTL